MDTDLQPNAEQPHLTHRVNASARVCISVHLCLSVVSSFQLPFLGSPVKHFLYLAPAVAKRPADQYTSMATYSLLSPCYTPHIPLVFTYYCKYEGNTRGVGWGYDGYSMGYWISRFTRSLRMGMMGGHEDTGYTSKRLHWKSVPTPSPLDGQQFPHA